MLLVGRLCRFQARQPARHKKLSRNGHAWRPSKLSPPTLSWPLALQPYCPVTPHKNFVMEEELKGLRHIASAIVGAKRASGNQGELRKLASDGLLQILKLKDENKRLCFQVEESKEETARSRQALEQSDLVLQNLLYEKQYYVKEIMACRAFQSKVKDEAVALMPVEDFFASLTDSAEDQALKEKALSNEHELMKARLVHENRLRKQLVKQMDQLKQMKVTLLNNVGQQERVLKDLQVGTGLGLHGAVGNDPCLHWA